MLAENRAEFTDHVAGIPAQIRWLELEQWPFEVRKNGQNNSWLNAGIPAQIRWLEQWPFEVRKIPKSFLSAVMVCG